MNCFADLISYERRITCNSKEVAAATFLFFILVAFLLPRALWLLPRAVRLGSSPWLNDALRVLESQKVPILAKGLLSTLRHATLRILVLLFLLLGPLLLLREIIDQATTRRPV